MACASAGQSSSEEPAAEPVAKWARGETDLVSFLTEDDTGRQPDRPSIEQQITAYYMQHATAATGPLVFWKAAVTCPSLAALARHVLGAHAFPGAACHANIYLVPLA